MARTIRNGSRRKGNAHMDATVHISRSFSWVEVLEVVT